MRSNPEKQPARGIFILNKLESGNYVLLTGDDGAFDLTLKELLSIRSKVAYQISHLHGTIDFTEINRLIEKKEHVARIGSRNPLSRRRKNNTRRKCSS